MNTTETMGDLLNMINSEDRLQPAPQPAPQPQPSVESEQLIRLQSQIEAMTREKEQIKEYERLLAQEEYKISHTKPKTQSKTLRALVITGMGYFAAENYLPPEMQSMAADAIVAIGGAVLAYIRVKLTGSVLT